MCQSNAVAQFHTMEDADGAAQNSRDEYHMDADVCLLVMITFVLEQLGVQAGVCCIHTIKAIAQAWVVLSRLVSSTGVHQGPFVYVSEYVVVVLMGEAALVLRVMRMT